MKKGLNIALAFIALGAGVMIAHDWYRGLNAEWNVWVLALVGCASLFFDAIERAFPWLGER